MRKNNKKLYGGNNFKPMPAIVEPPKYGSSYRQSAVMEQQIDVHKQNSMVNGKPFNQKNINGGSSSKMTIPNLGAAVGLKSTPMSHGALVGHTNTNLQTKENGIYDADLDGPPVPFKGGKRKKHTRTKRKRKSKKHTRTKSKNKKLRKSKKNKGKRKNKK